MLPISQLRSLLVDACQYCNWSEAIFRQLVAGHVSGIVATIAYHEDFRETVEHLVDWNRQFERHGDLIIPGRTANDIDAAAQSGRTAVFFALQNCSPIEDDIGLLEILHRLGVRVMQLTYNNQSLLGAGCYEPVDSGITRMGREVIAEMNRLGFLIDMSHSGERSTLEAIEISQRPIAITHANPYWWRPAVRNKSDAVLKALADSGGMLGLSLYPHHLRDGSACTIASFAEMAARLADQIGVERIGIGSDLCQDQPDSVVFWMRDGRWTKTTQAGAGAKAGEGFPPQPDWFRDNRDWPHLRAALIDVGFGVADADKVMGGNWRRFFGDAFGPGV